MERSTPAMLGDRGGGHPSPQTLPWGSAPGGCLDQAPSHQRAQRLTGTPSPVQEESSELHRCPETKSEVISRLADNSHLKEFDQDLSQLRFFGKSWLLLQTMQSSTALESCKSMFQMLDKPATAKCLPESPRFRRLCFRTGHFDLVISRLVPEVCFLLFSQLR